MVLVDDFELRREIGILPEDDALFPDLFLAKNVAVMVVVALQLTLLLAIDAWQSGVMQLGADIVVATVLLLAHLA